MLEENNLPQEPVYEPSDATVQFMLSEIERVAEYWRHADQMADSRLNVFISISSGAVGVLLVISQLQATSREFMSIGSVIFFVIWVLGLITFFRMMKRNQVVVEYIRAINRLRCFFVNLDPTIEKYQWLPLTDSLPKFTDLGARKFSSRTAVSILSSIGFGLMFSSVSSLAFGNAHISSFSILVAALTFVVHFVILESHVTRTFKRLEQGYEIRFPNTVPMPKPQNNKNKVDKVD